MILNTSDTTISYRCPDCGGWVESIVNIFNLSADMIRLKCSCGKSDMTVEITRDKKVRMKVPCFVCPKPHTFTTSLQMFMKRDFLSFPCDYSGIDICIMGEKNSVHNAELESDKELELILGENEYNNLSQYAKESEDLDYASNIDMINFVIKDLDEAGEISCKCPSDEGLYDIDIKPDGFVLYCENCNCSKKFELTSSISAQAFLDCTHIDLE